MSRAEYDAVVVGSGPNGLAAAIRLAQAGWSVLVVEAKPTPGGGARSAEITLPGFTHDLCSAVHPLGLASPFFRSLSLERHGLKWIEPEIAVAHPLDGGKAAALYPSLERTAEALGSDGRNYRRLMHPFVNRWEELFEEVLAPLHFPKHPFELARFGLQALLPASTLARARFREEPARALFGGLAAHSFLPLNRAPSAAIGLMLGIAGHSVGWPIPEGGAQRITDALISCLRSLGGEIITDFPVMNVHELPRAKAVLFDLVPRRLLRIAGAHFPRGYRSALKRFHYGPGIYKLDWALSAPIPWEAESCRSAGTVHLGGTLVELEESELAPWQGRTAERPFVLLSQPTVFDPTRAPEGKHIAWAYCHLPRGSTEDMSERIEAQIERFAPGFRSRILARTVTSPQQIEEENRNCAGGDISGGIPDLKQLLFRPVIKADPYKIPVRGWYLCSSSTPPGAGVHGMCGFHAAESVLRRESGRAASGFREAA